MVSTPTQAAIFLSYTILTTNKMPVLKPKQMVWKCRFEDCGFEMSDKSKSTMFNKGFEHHLEKHGLIELNYDWYSKHIQNYFLIE